MKKIEYRAYIKTRVLLKISARDIHDELKTAHGDNASEYSTLARWAAIFKSGETSLEDNPRSGRPITTFTRQNIERVRAIVYENPYASCAQIEAETSINHYTLLEILHNALGLRKLTSRWIPHELTDENRQERVAACHENLAKVSEGKLRLCDIITGDELWLYLRQIGHKQSNASWVAECKSARVLVKRDRFESKNLFYIFFRSTGFVYVGYVEKGQTITGDYYIQNCLKPVENEMRRQRPKSGLTNLKLLHDNARPHVQKAVKGHFNQVGITTIRHPPYSPDLAPCDFWLFDLIKQKLGDHTDPESQKREITRILRDIPDQEYKKTFEKWVERMQLCINNNGHYFENLIK